MSRLRSRAEGAAHAAKNIGAVVVGLIVGMTWNMALIQLNQVALFPPPEGANLEDPEQLKAYTATLPLTAFLVVLVAHVGQAGIGGWVATRVGKSHPMRLAGIVGAFTALGAIAVQLMLDGPAWMWVDVPLILAAAWSAGNCGRKRLAQAAQTA